LQGLYQFLQDRFGHEQGITFAVYAIIRDATANRSWAIQLVVWLLLANFGSSSVALAIGQWSF